MSIESFYKLRFGLQQQRLGVAVFGHAVDQFRAVLEAFVEGLQAVADSVPPAMQKLNLQAFDKGFEYGSDLVHRMAENGDAEPMLLETES